MLSGRKLLCGLLSNDLRPSGSVNMLGGPKKVILVASGEGWVEQSPLGVCPLLHFIQVQLPINSEFVLLFGKCSITLTRMIVYIMIFISGSCHENYIHVYSSLGLYLPI